MKKYFITGTDTDVGKTLITRLLLAKAKQLSQTALAIKPVAAGVGDATFLQQESSILLPYEIINPFLLQAAISPHIAAQREQIQLDARTISTACERAYRYPVDYLFFEGAGGWQVPINTTETMADVVQHLNIPVIIVIAMRLGCLNHALLSVDHILNKNLTIAGFVANQAQEAVQEAFAENIATLQQWIPAPLLGVIPYSINKDIHTLTHSISLP